MAVRRRDRFNRTIRSRSSDVSRKPLGDAVERRLRQLRTTLNDLQQALDAQSKRTAAMQAQIDHLDARVRGI